MADLRAKYVMDEFADLVSVNFYAIDVAAQQVGDRVKSGDTLDVGSITALTVNASGSATASPETVTSAALALVVDREPWINAKIPRLQAEQSNNGRWAANIAAQALIQLKNKMDTDYAKYVIETAWVTGTASTYGTNVAADTLTSADILNAKATVLSNLGSLEQNLRLLVHPYGEASIRSISTFVPNSDDAEMGMLGISKLGKVHGIPTFMTNSMYARRTYASSAWSVTGNVLTITVLAGHGIVAGVPITFDTVTAGGDLATAAAVTSTTATTVVVPLTAANGSATEAGTITVQASENLLIDVGHNYVAQQRLPSTRIVALSDSTGDTLQVSSAWGRIGRAGRANVLYSPPASA